MPRPSSPPLRSLERRLGPVDAAAIVIANVIGAGIFFTPGIITTTVPSPPTIIGVWVFGGLLAFFGAMAYAELATMRPRSGGEYVYLREAFGPLAAFLTGWTSFVAGFAGAIAAAALSVADYLGAFVPAARDATPIASLPVGPFSFVFSNQSLIALTAIGGLAFIHIRGLGPGRLVQNTLAAIKVGGLTLFVAAGLGWGHGTMAHVSAEQATGSTNLALAMLLVMFTYSGWNAASYVAEEIRDPGRNVPRALAMGTCAVVLIYLGICLVYLYALPVSQVVEMANSPGGAPSLDHAARVLLGPNAARLLGGLAVVILLSSLSAMTLAGPRVYYAMARDGVFFRGAATVHPRFHTPWLAILAQAVWSGLLVLTNTKDRLAEYTGFAVLLFSGFAVAAVFVLRFRHPNEERPFRALGYPVAPAVFTIASLVISVIAVTGRPRQAAWGLLVMFLGVPLYLWMRRRSGERESASREAPGA